MELVGVRAAPNETLHALKEAVKGVKFNEALVTLVTDWQDQRANARFAIWVREGKHRVLTLDAFGPRFGAAGDDALRDAVQWFLERGVSIDLFREVILPPSEYSELFEMDGDDASQMLVIKAGYADPKLYINRGFTSRM